MTFSEIAQMMYPYWIMGVIMMAIVFISPYRKLLRIEPRKVLHFMQILGIITIYRILVFTFLKGNDDLNNMVSGAMTIPWQASLTVFWEDAMHTLPLAIFGLWLGTDKLWKKIAQWSAIAMVMVSFGLGHVYQGWLAAAFLSLYIPFTLKKGKEVGFGTVMICHMLYDLVTILTIRAFLG